MEIINVLAVGIGGSLGAVSRYAVGLAIERRAVDTLAVNVLGSFLLGVVLGFGVDSGTPLALAVAVGFCGAFTTFSSFAVETVRLAEDGHRFVAAVNAVGTLIAALLAVLTGIAIGNWV